MNRYPICPSHGICPCGRELCTCENCTGVEPFDCVDSDVTHCCFCVGECERGCQDVPEMDGAA